MKRRRVTSREVAERAGVSRTTVSFVLNDVEGANIPDETRQRVLAAARDLQYVPDTAARALARGRSQNIAFVLFRTHPQIFTDPYVPNVMTGFTQTAQSRGFRLLVEQISNFEQARVVGDLLRGGEVAGILISGWVWGHDELLVPLIEAGYPILSTDDLTDTRTSVPYITIDHMNGVRTATQHLVALGHRRIGCITYGPTTDLHVMRRLNVVRSVLRDAGIELEDRYVREGAFEPSTGHAAALSLLAEREPPTAIFGMNDLMALGALSAVQQAGMRVPEHIAIMGYDDMRFSAYTTPPLSTMHAPEMEMGRRAGELLLGMLEGTQRMETPVTMPTRLIVRASCGAKDREG